MKKFIITSILVALFATGSTLKAQDNQNDYLGLPGDNLNLYAVMKLFQESKTLEDFERSLNDPNSTINNLDLNGDNLVDYIKVIDNVDGDVHNIVLQVAVSPVQNQDVAVFSVQRFQNGQVMIQLTGDEALYGKNYIVEPNYDDANSRETANPGYTGNNRPVNEQYVTYTSFQIASWPLIRFIFLPSYTIWHSSWRWDYYPNYWHPWRPFSWNYYYGYQYNWNRDYVRNYRRIDYHRYDRWNDYYYSGRRTYSPEVNHRIEMGSYKTTYSHPEQRRDGETTFAKNHPEQYRRSAAVANSSNNRRSTENMINRPVTNIPQGDNREINRSSARPMENKSVQNPQSGNNKEINRNSNRPIDNKSVQNPPSGNNKEINRNSARPINNKSVQNPQGGNNVEVNKRSTTPTINKSVQNPPAGNNTISNRRSTTTETNRSVTNPSVEKNTVTKRQTTTTVTDKSVANPSMHQNTVTNKTNNQPKKKEVNTTNRRNVKKTETNVKKGDKIKDSDNKDSNHRN